MSPPLSRPTPTLQATAARIAASKTFDHATSCSSENSLVVIGEAWQPLLAALTAEGGMLATPDEKSRLETAMFPYRQVVARLLSRNPPRSWRNWRDWIVTATRHAASSWRTKTPSHVGPRHPLSGEKLSPVMTLYHVADFDAAVAQVHALYDYQGKGHSVGVHGASPEEILRLGLELPVTGSSSIRSTARRSAALSTTACPSPCRWDAAHGAAMDFPTTSLFGTCSTSPASCAPRRPGSPGSRIFLTTIGAVTDGSREIKCAASLALAAQPICSDASDFTKCCALHNLVAAQQEPI